MPPIFSKFNWLITSKLYHLLFWGVYHYFWWAFSSGDPLQAANNIFFSVYSTKFLFYVLFQAAAVYINLYVLIPRYLEKGKWVPYFSLLFATIMIACAFIVLGYDISVLLSGQSWEDLFPTTPHDYVFLFKQNALGSTIASTTLAMSIKLTKNWIQAQQRQQMLEKEKLETELKFLKSQFNPHFLFNTINSIFCLIHKNPDQASESLAKFSDLLRYQLYECNEHRIPLAHEFVYIENFVGLERLRQESSLDLSLHIDSEGSANLVIAPFLLMPFIENAFKHVSQFSQGQNWIDIQIKMQENQLIAEISNSISPHPSTDLLQVGGIGLKNVQRRLDLLYPGQYELDILSGNDDFRIRLQLALAAHTDSNSETPQELDSPVYAIR